VSPGTTVAVTTDDVSGALLRVLEPFAAHDLSLTRLVARPTGEPWQYRFIFDLAHAGGDSRVERAFEIVRRASRTFRSLGTYPIEAAHASPHAARDAASSLLDSHAAAMDLARGHEVRAIRGAVDVDEDTPAAITAATTELVREIVRRNHVRPADIISAVFTTTPDLRSQFPATAARDAGWQDVPLICASEMAVPGSLPRCIRALVHIRRSPTAPSLQPVYLGRAASLRPDLASRDTT